MLEFVSQRSFGEFARDRVSADNDLGRPTVLSSLVLWEGTPDWRSGPNPRLGTESTPGSLKSEEIRRGKEGVGSRSAHSHHPDGTAVLPGIHNSLMEKRLSSVTLLGQEPNIVPPDRFYQTFYRRQREPGTNNKKDRA